VPAPRPRIRRSFAPWADTMIVIQSPRLHLGEFQRMNAPEVFGCITPAIAQFMPWEPPWWSE